MKPIPASYVDDYHKDCIPRRPWWRVSEIGNVVDGDARVWRRDDGVVLLPEQQGSDGAITRPPQVILPSGDRVPVPDGPREKIPLGAIGWFDTAEPMGPPAPAVGQVWTAPNQERAVIATYNGRAIMPQVQVQMGNVVGFPLNVEPEWPPRGAWLRAGPGSPWSPS